MRAHWLCSRADNSAAVYWKAAINNLNGSEFRSCCVKWKSRWPSCSPSYGFCVRKATLNHAHALVTVCPSYVNPTSEDIKLRPHHHQQRLRTASAASLSGTENMLGYRFPVSISPRMFFFFFINVGHEAAHTPGIVWTPVWAGSFVSFWSVMTDIKWGCRDWYDRPESAIAYPTLNSHVTFG